MDSEYQLLELEVKSLGFRNADDFIRKRISLLSERQLRLLDMIGFDFKEK